MKRQPSGNSGLKASRAAKATSPAMEGRVGGDKVRIAAGRSRRRGHGGVHTLPEAVQPSFVSQVQVAANWELGGS